MHTQPARVVMVHGHRPLRLFDQVMPEFPGHRHRGSCECTPTVAYIRVSKIGNRKNIKSPAIQLDSIVEDARRSDRRIVKMVFDLNQSGRTFDRRALNEVMEDLRADRYRHVSVWKWSRWGRTILGSMMMLDEVQQLGATVHSATEPFDQSSVWGEIGRDQTILVASIQSKMIGEGWRAVHQQRIKEGLPPTGKPRFGYRVVDREYVPDSVTAPLLRSCYVRYNAGATLRSLAEELQRDGVPTPEGAMRWDRTTLGRLMDTGFAAGLYRSRSPEMRDRLKRSKQKGVAIWTYDVWSPMRHERIIDQGVWDVYRERRIAQADLPARGRSATHPFTSLLFCGLCGRRLGVNTAGATIYYCCPASSKKVHHPSRSVTVHERGLTAFVREWLETLTDQPTWLAEEAARKAAAMAQSGPSPDELESQRRDLEKRKRGVLSLLTEFADASPATRADLMGQIEKFNVDLARIERDLTEVEKPPVMPDFTGIGKVLDQWDSWPTSVLREALSKVIQGVVVLPVPVRGVKSPVKDRVRVVGRWEEFPDLSPASDSAAMAVANTSQN